MKKLIIIKAFLMLGIIGISQTTEHFSYRQALITDSVRCIAVDNNNVWIGTVFGITMFDGNDFISFNTNDGIGDNLVYDIHVHSSGVIYAATAGGLSQYEDGSWTNMNIGDGMPSNVIWSVTEDTDGRIWIGTSDVGVAYYQAGIWHQFSTSHGLISNSVRTILSDRIGNMWFGTGNGISVYDGENFTTHNMSTGLPGTIINDIIQLDNGNIAVATNGGVGVFNYNSWENIKTEDGLPAANILSIRQDYEMNLIMGSASGLIIYNGNSFELFNYDDGLANNIVTKVEITKAGDNKIWCTSPFSGVTVYDNNNTFIIYRKNKNIINDNVNVITVDDENIVWIGTGNGLNRVDDLHWRSYQTKDGLINNDITAVHKDITGNIWIGTTNGISVIDGQNITNISTSEGLPHQQINGITSDPLGKVYVATENKLTLIEDMAVTNTYGTEEGLFHNKINNIHYENNRLWLLFDEAIQYISGTDTIDVTDDGCVLNQNSGKAVCYNCTDGQYFGTDYSLRLFKNGTEETNCWEHPYPGTATIMSIVETDDGLLCSFDNGKVHLFDGITWTEISTDFDVSFIADYNKQYLWWGYQSEGVAKECINCSETIEFTATSPDCHGTANGSVQITSPAGTEYSIDNGQTWQISSLFENLYGGYKHIIVKNDADNIIADSLIYLEFYNHITNATITISQIDCYANDNGSVILEYDFTGSHKWENENTTILERTGLGPGIYSVTISDNASCEIILENKIIEPAQLLISEYYEDVSCHGFDDGLIELTISGGVLPYDIEWSTGHTEQNIYDLSGNTYSYTITDANNCSNNNSIEILEPTLLGVSDNIQNVFCYGESTGSVIIEVSGGKPPYQIVWSPHEFVDNGNITNAVAGTYHLTVTDSNECVFTEAYTIGQPDVFEISGENVVNVYCYGEETGEIEIQITGGYGDYELLWIKDEETEAYSNEQNLYNIGTGTYYVTITDENLCSITAEYEITQSPELIVSIEVIPISCAGYSDGEIIATASGGTENYISYLWKNEDGVPISGSYEPHITGLSEGYYEVIVTDNYYCTDTASVILYESEPYDYQIETIPMSCNGVEDGEIVITVDGELIEDFNFEWQNGVAGNTNIATELGKGTYAITVTAPDGCKTVLSANITEPPPDVIGVFPDIEYVCYGESTELDPGEFESYEWSTEETTQTIIVENPGVYIVNVTDFDGCNLTDTVQVIISHVYQDEELSLASITDDGNIKLIWQKTENKGTDFYKIYKDEGDGFEYLASKPFDEFAIYEDNNVDPANYYYSYKISVIDSCGNESDYSDIHTTMLLDVSYNQGTCYLNWTSYEGFFVVYYYIMSGDSPDNLQITDSTMYMNNEYVDTGLQTEGTYYRLKIKRIDGAYPGDGNYYNKAYSNIVFCDNEVNVDKTTINEISIYPVPFENQFYIKFYLPESSMVNIALFDLLGRETNMLEKQKLLAGEHLFEFTPDIAPGIYSLRINIGEKFHTYRVVRQ